MNHRPSALSKVCDLMPILQLPKSIKWLLSCAFIMLLFMTVYRVACISLFKQDFPGTIRHTGSVVWLGFRFDSRLVAGVTLLLLLLSIFPATHLFKTSLGKYTAYVVYGLFAAVLLVFYAADFASLFSFHSRLRGDVFTEIGRNTDAAIHFRRQVPWWLAIPGILVCAWIFFLVIKFVHKLISKKRSGKEDRLVRAYWQLLVFLLCVLALWGRIGNQPLSASNASKTIPATAITLALTPVETFFANFSGEAVLNEQDSPAQ